MIFNIDPVKSAIASILSAAVGTFSEKIALKCALLNLTFPVPVDIAIQRLAWTVAILAGIISAWNGLMTARERYKKNHPKSIE